MGLRERIEQEIRAAIRHGGSRVNVARRVNRVVVTNEGGGTAAASADQVAPIIQEPGPPSEER